MSFLFIQKAREAKKAPKKGRTPATTLNKQAAETLHRLGCKACPLDSGDACTPKMKPTFGDGPVYFLAEAPGRHEDETSHRPLTGPSGTLLRNVLADWAGPDDSLSFDNVVNCRPPDNRTPTPQEVECCRPRRIKFIEQAKPKLIVGLGAVPLNAIIGTNDLSGSRGRFFAVQIGQHRCWFMPTYHPSYILRIAKDKHRPLQSMMGHCFRMDVAKALEAVDGLPTPQIHTEQDVRAGIEVFDGSSGFDRALELLGRAKAAKVKAVDLETRYLRPYTAGAGLMSVAVSFNDEYNFAFAIDHPQAKWTVAQKERLLKAFAQLLQDDTTKVAHNAPFELEWLAWLYGPEIINHTAWDCTMMQAHFLDERKGNQWDDTARASKYHGLDFLIRQNFGLSFKQLFETNKKDQSKTDLNELLVYNAADTKYTLKLYHIQKKALGTNGDRTAYRLAVMQQPTVALMEHLGVCVDQVAVKRAQNKLAKEVAALEFNINNLSVVKQYIADRKGFNPGAATTDVLYIFRDYLKRKEVLVTPEHGQIRDFDKSSANKAHPNRTMKELDLKPRYSTDKAVLEKIDHPLSKLIINWRNRTKLKSTYVDGLSLEVLKDGGDCVIYPDGRLHTSFNTTTTETGRLSSDTPNLQNYPKRHDAWVRQLIVPPQGQVMVAIDYGQLEGCTGAMCSKDTYLCKALWDDYDLHMDWAKLIAREKPAVVGGRDYLNDKDAMKQWRSLVKNKLVFPAFYGANADSIAGYLNNATGLEFSEQYVDRVLDRFWHVLSGMKSWQDNLMKRYWETGYVTTLGGRKHRYPLTRNQAINHPFQGTAAELVSDAMSRLSYLAAQTGHWYLHPILAIHDDLTFFLPEKGFEKAIETILKEMLVFDFPWVNVPMAAEVSVGRNWHSLQPLGKFWSHKEFGYPNAKSTQPHREIHT